jgi:hypothetical protein
LSIIKSDVVDFSNRKWEVKNNFQSWCEDSYISAHRNSHAYKWYTCTSAHLQTHYKINSIQKRGQFKSGLQKK